MKLSELSSAGLQSYVGALVEEQNTPGLSVAVWHRGELCAAAAGVVNVETGAPASTDTLFQIGSISKVFTTSLLMLLVDHGKIELDEPIKKYHRDFHVANAKATESITARQLLSHTAGLESDIFIEDYWEQGNPIARYVDRCCLLPQVHTDFGKRYSYSNAAFSIAGRLVEIIEGRPWAQVIEEEIYRPLGMKFAISSPIQTLRYSASMGHMYRYGGSSAGEWTTAPYCYFPLGMAPAGSVLSMSAADLVRFARAHLNGGMSETGRQWLSKASVKTMQAWHVDLPAPTSLLESGWGLGWSLSAFGGAKVFGHGGGAIGHQAVLQVIPEHDCVLSVLANGMKFGGSPLLRTVQADLLSRIGIVVPAAEARTEIRDLQCYVGRYGTGGFKFDIVEAGEHLAVELTQIGLSTGKVQFDLTPTANDSFAVYSPSGELWEHVKFLEPDHEGRPRYFFYGNRLNVRLSE